MTTRSMAVKCVKAVLGEERYLNRARPSIVYVLNIPRRVLGRIRQVFLQFLLMQSMRSFVLRARYIYFAKIRGKLSVYTNSDEAVSDNTIKYNLQAFTFPLILDRTRVLIRPFSVIETLSPNSHILVVGPRSEDDILHLMAYGFSKVRGLDLISYSPYVDLGDMHHMPYDDNTFDAVVLGWVIPYSNKPEIVAKEVIRVARNGAVIAIGGEHHPDYINAEQLKQQAVAQLGYQIGGRHLNSTAAYLELFSGAVKKVFFDHEIGSERRDRTTNTSIIFSIRK